MPRSIEIFLCYAREDEALRQGLEKHLRVLRRQGIINLWHDRSISAGTEWEREIDNHLNTARIILLLISPDFLDSDYCYSIEMKRAMERHERGEACVIPIILRPVYWHKTPFGKLQALPTDGKPIVSSKWFTQDEALFDAAEGIRTAVEDIVAKEEAKQRVDKGNTLYDQQQYDKAISAYEQALQYDPKCFQAYHNKGITLTTLCKYDDAIATFEQALRIKPNEAETSKAMGELLIHLKRYKEASQVFERALQANPDDDLKKRIKALLDAMNETSKAQQLYARTEQLNYQT